MARYNQLTLEERIRIECMLDDGKSPAEIAQKLGRHPSTIYREITRNDGRNGTYVAEWADILARRREAVPHRKSIISDPEIFDFIYDHLINHLWSPEQIAGTLNKIKGFCVITTQTIYNLINKDIFDKPKQEKAKRKLRHRGKRRRKKGEESGRGKFDIQHTIHERPDNINNRERIGDWELDLVIGRPGGKCLVTLVERATGFLAGGLSDDKTAASVNKVIKRTILDNKVYSITTDRGKEFAKYDEIQQMFGVTFYFADPHSPWQKGTNENTNGLIRQYIPKGKSMDNLTEDQVRHIFNELNFRPRKRLGFETPSDAYKSVALGF